MVDEIERKTVAFNKELARILEEKQTEINKIFDFDLNFSQTAQFLIKKGIRAWDQSAHTTVNDLKVKGAKK